MNYYTIGSTTLKSLIESETAYELCRKLVFPAGEAEPARGAGIHLIDVSGKIRLIAHFGRLDESFTKEVYSWEDHLLASAATSNSIREENNGDTKTAALPLVKNGTPMGVMSLFLDFRTELKLASKELIDLISIAGGRFLDISGLGTARLTRSEGFEDWKDLTERQMQVLRGMSQNMTNAEIARELLLSESTIRQETVRIYRALQVSGRIEAAKKAKALGLLGTQVVTAAPEYANV